MDLAEKLEIETDIDWEQVKKNLYVHFILYTGLTIMFTALVYFLLHVGDPAL